MGTVGLAGVGGEDPKHDDMMNMTWPMIDPTHQPLCAATTTQACSSMHEMLTFEQLRSAQNVLVLS